MFLPATNVTADYLEGNLFKLYVAIALSFFCVNSFAYSENGVYPKGPEEVLTPGELCNSPDAYRYPEKVAYCNRDVSPELKKTIFVKYDQMGYRTRELNRMDFKIDHYIPLCMGGSNSDKNLWPQHKKIYEVTDPLEPVLCDKMAAGRLLQKKAIEYIVRAKHNLKEVSKIMAEVHAL